MGMPSTTTSIQFNNYLKDFSTLAGNNDPYQPEWLTEVSKNALEEFIRMGSDTFSIKLPLLLYLHVCQGETGGSKFSRIRI